MKRNNFELALRRAIERELEIETAEQGPMFKSVFLRGLEEIQAAVNRGEAIEIVEES